MLKLRRSGAPLGAEITGVDLARGVDDALFAEITRAFHEHAVLVFRDQTLDTEQHVAFSRRFGDLDVNVRSEFNKDGRPEVLVLSNILSEGKPIGVQDAGRYWHSDLCYLRRPARATFLRALEIPHKDGEAVGDTLFASMTAAYEELSPKMKRRLEGLEAVQSYRYTYEKKAKDFRLRPRLADRGDDWIPEDVEHPVVREHPFTGRKCLYVNEGYTTRIVGWPEAESGETLEFLFEHVIKPEFLYRHRWQAGDLLMWDNCAAQHKAVADYALPLRRRMERTTVRGTVPF